MELKDPALPTLAEKAKALSDLQDRAAERLDVSFLMKARKIVFNYVKEHLEKTDTHVHFSLSDVYVVWFSKTLQNWKALISTMLPDGMYYEVTYNGNDQEAYLDAYKKFDNVVVRDIN